MGKLLAFSSQLLAKKVVVLIAIVVLALSALGAGDSDAARFKALGQKMMCLCGCNQMLLECNHVGCPDSDRMRAKLAASVKHGDNDDTILSSFVEDYGNTVLAAPTTKGFNRVAWIMPFAVLLAGSGVAFTMARRWQTRRRLEPAPGVPDGDRRASDDLNYLRERTRRETEI
jgi:cytochrome c-type biogenesis protein CcmH